MSEFWSISWLVIKYGFIAGFSLFIITSLFILFHPIYLTLKGRGSIKGQRGEIKVSYLFGLLRLRYIASAHTQDLWLEFFKFRKLLERETVIDEKKLLKHNENKAENELSDSDSSLEKEEKPITQKESNNELNLDEQKIEEILKEKENKNINTDTEDKDESVEKETVSETEISENAKEPEKETTKEEDFSTEKLEDDINIKNSEIDNDEEQELPKVVATPEQLAELQNILEEEEKQEQLKKESPKKDWGEKIRKLQAKFNNKFQKLRKIAIIIKEKWSSLWPVIKRFWNRGKKGFKFHNAYLKVEYSLDEHYLTGMCCGYIAPTIGFAKRYGIDFEPIPLFPNQPEAGIYSKVSWNVDILPYRLIWAITALIFEKNIYKELYWLYKMKKKKKQNN